MGFIEKLQASKFIPSPVAIKKQFHIPLNTTPNSIDMSPNILPAEIELYRLEQRYARRKHRSTFSGVQYVDGEYVYSNGSNSPTGTVSKHSTGSYWKSPSWGGSGSESRWR